MDMNEKVRLIRVTALQNETVLLMQLQVLLEGLGPKEIRELKEKSLECKSPELCSRIQRAWTSLGYES